MRRMAFWVLAAVLCCTVVSCRSVLGDGGVVRKQPPMAKKAVPDQPLPDLAKKLKLESPLKDAHFVVYKKQRIMELYSGDRLVKTYPVAFGFEPEGHKEMSGDGRTPEGEYYLFKHKSPSFGKCFYISYPNIEDARVGLEKQLINQSQYDKIVKANEDKAKPLHETGLGGLILIHGTKDREEQNLTASNWTHGCIAMENEHILELLDAIPDNARPEIVIHPGEKQAPPEDTKKKSDPDKKK